MAATISWQSWLDMDRNYVTVTLCRFGASPRTVDDMLTAAVREFGPVALRPVRKGDNVGWFLDQMMLSVFVADWSQRHGAATVIIRCTRCAVLTCAHKLT